MIYLVFNIYIFYGQFGYYFLFELNLTFNILKKVEFNYQSFKKELICCFLTEIVTKMLNFLP